MKNIESVSDDAWFEIRRQILFDLRDFITANSFDHLTVKIDPVSGILGAMEQFQRRELEADARLALKIIARSRNQWPVLHPRQHAAAEVLWAHAYLKNARSATVVLGSARKSASVTDPNTYLSFCIARYLEYLPPHELNPILTGLSAEIVPNRKFGRQVQQETLILELLQENGINPLRLPRYVNGKKGVKAQIKKLALEIKHLFVSSGVFDGAWARLNQKKMISYQNN